MTKKATIFIATGGTGGHIFPARCLAKNLESNHKVIIIADKKYQNYIENDDNFESKIIACAQFSKSFTRIFFGAIKISLGVAKSLFLILKHRPKYIFAFGGYATFPILLAAVILKRKIILHEQNAHFGKVNRIFAKFSHKIALTFAKTDAVLEKFQAKSFITGNPIRHEIAKLNEKNYILPQKVEVKKRDKMGYKNIVLASEFNDLEKAESEKKLFNILIIGGSGGAQIFSEILPKTFFNLSEEIKNELEIHQQCRQDLLQETFDTYEKLNLNIEIEAFFDDMAKKIDDAHLIIARSGSSSLAEFGAAKKPMILIPFANSADNHQLKNAKIFAKNNCAIVIEEKDFTINKAAKILTNLLRDKKKLIEMSQNCQKVTNLDAAQNLANLMNS